MVARRILFELYLFKKTPWTGLKKNKTNDTGVTSKNIKHATPTQQHNNTLHWRELHSYFSVIAAAVLESAQIYYCIYTGSACKN